MNAGTPKTGAWRGVVVVRHFVALRDESDALVECSTRKIADSGVVYGHAAAKPDVFTGRSP
ncbi:hypothetical protein [Salmonella enterica]|uniref:hypothetical protein n=1 Tax=Salmonella enterica TaxID=28901 RepID=UPI003219DDAA